MKDFNKNCSKSHSIIVIDNGYIVSGNCLGDNEEHYCKNFHELVNHLARRLNITEIGELLSVMTTPRVCI